MNTENNQLYTLLLILLIFNIFASLLHYTDNFLFFDKYPAPDWMTPHSVYIAWLILTPFGIAGYRQYTKGVYGIAYLCLGIYSITSIGGLAHYLFARIGEFSGKMNALIWFEVVTGIILIGFIVYSGLFLKEWSQQKVINKEPC